MKKADYNRISTSYDRGRAISDENIDRWLELIQEYTSISNSSSLLDLGCGTGRFALPIADRFRCRVTGADSSPEMLAKAREKDVSGLVAWDLQNAGSLTYSDRSFNIVFLSHLLHHTDSPPNVLKECKRVLTSPGVILIRYGAIEQIRDDVEHTFFPETVPIDEVRTPSVALVEKWLAEAGFEKVTSLELVQRTYSSGTARLKAIRLKSTSVLTLIQQKALEDGIRRLEKYVKEKPDDPWLVSDKLTLTVGYKRR
ncbi:MAG: methyltransferase domain-containing protein [bacterium]